VKRTGRGLAREAGIARASEVAREALDKSLQFCPPAFEAGVTAWCAACASV